MKKLFAVAVLAVTVSGCAALLSPQASEKIVQGVKTYCVQPEEQRLLLRATVNANLAGEAEVKVICKGDVESGS